MNLLTFLLGFALLWMAFTVCFLLITAWGPALLGGFGLTCFVLAVEQFSQ